MKNTRPKFNMQKASVVDWSVTAWKYYISLVDKTKVLYRSFDLKTIFGDIIQKIAFSSFD